MSELKAVRKAPAAAADGLVVKFRELGRELRNVVLEREHEVHGAIVALLTRMNCFFFGPPGTGKSYMAHLICKALGGNYFEFLMAKGTKPEELLGTVKLSLLAQDRYVFNTEHRLPTAHIAFLDEVWKANSAVLNNLLKALNEREFVQDGVVERIPLQTAFAASNELPEDASLAALYDRFQLRYDVRSIQDDANFELLMQSSDEEPVINTAITLDELAAAQQQVKDLMMDNLSVISALLRELRAAMQQAGFTYSDRRWKQMRRLLAANAWLAGRVAITRDDIEVLVPMMWDRPEQVRDVKRVVLSFSNPDLKAAMELLDQAAAIHAEAMQAASVSAEVGKQMRSIVGRLNALMASARRDEIIRQVRDLQQQVAARIAGL